MKEVLTSRKGTCLQYSPDVADSPLLDPIVPHPLEWRGDNHPERTGARLARPEVTEADRTAAEQEAPLYSVPPIPTTTTDDRLRLPLKEDDGKTSKSVSEMNHIDLEARYKNEGTDTNVSLPRADLPLGHGGHSEEPEAGAVEDVDSITAALVDHQTSTTDEQTPTDARSCGEICLYDDISC